MRQVACRLLLLLSIIGFSFSLPLKAFAYVAGQPAKLSVTPAQTSSTTGQQFQAEVHLDAGTAVLSALALSLTFPITTPDDLRFVSTAINSAVSADWDVLVNKTQTGSGKASFDLMLMAKGTDGKVIVAGTTLATLTLTADRPYTSKAISFSQSQSSVIRNSDSQDILGTLTGATWTAQGQTIQTTPSPSPSPSPTPTPTPSPTPSPSPSPSSGSDQQNQQSCNTSCTSNAQCASQLCFQGSCRNQECPSQSSCSCSQQASPTPTPTPSPQGIGGIISSITNKLTKKASPTPSPSSSPSPTPTSTPITTPGASPISTPAPTAQPKRAQPQDNTGLFVLGGSLLALVGAGVSWYMFGMKRSKPVPVSQNPGVMNQPQQPPVIPTPPPAQQPPIPQQPQV